MDAFLDAWQSSVPEVCFHHEPKQVHNSNGRLTCRGFIREGRPYLRARLSAHARKAS